MINLNQMINLKLSVFVVSLIAAAVVGGVGSRIVLPKPQSCACGPTLDKNLLRREEALRQQRRGGPIKDSALGQKY
jgi:hypothetical protein